LAESRRIPGFCAATGANQEVDLPARFTVVYQDLERDADIGTQYAKRVAGPSSAMHSQNEATFDLPLVLSRSTL
jgi:hypothetical protein